MKRLFASLAAALTLYGVAHGQGPGASIDATNTAQDDAIAALIAKNTAQDGELATRADIDRAIGLEIIDIKKRLDALEAAEPPPSGGGGGTEPPPGGGGGGTEPPPVDPPPSGARSPLTLGAPYHSTYWSHEDAFIDHVLVANRDYDLQVSQGFIDEATATYVKLPATGPLVLGLVREGTTDNPAHYAGKWIIDWQGDCDLALNSGSVGDLVRVNANRIEETYDPARHGSNAPRLVITRIGQGGCKAVRYYRAEHEQLLRNAQVFEPAWLARMSRFDILRGMDWSGTNRALETVAADRPLPNRASYFDGRVPDQIIIRMAIEAKTALWINSPSILGATPAAASALRAGGSLTRDQKLTAVAADGATILASPERLKWARTIVAELNKQGYPLNRPLYVEPANEVWNTTFNHTVNFHWGLTRHLRTQFPALRDSMRPGYGCIAGKLADDFQQALNEGGRGAQVWTLVVGAQTANVATTKDAFAGLKACGTGQPMSKFGVATTNYYSGAFNWKASNTLFGARMTESAWEAKWLADATADPVGFKAMLTAYMLGPVAEQNVKWMAQQWLGHKQAAEAEGAFWLGNYEGDSHEVLNPGLKANALASKIFAEWHEGPEHAAVIRAAVAEMKALDPKAIYANYAFCGSGRGPGAPWVECSPWDQGGEDNAAWNELLKP